MPTAVVAEDHDEMRVLIAQALRGAGYDVVEVHHGLGLATAVSEAGAVPQLIVTDVRMPWASGLAVLDALDRRGGARVPAIVVTAFPDAELRERVAKRPRTYLLEKPFELDALKRLAASILAVSA